MRTLLTLAAAVTLGLPASADTLRLKAGSSIQGTLISANSREISFLGPDGTQKSYPIDTVAGVDFTAGTGPGAAAAAPAPAKPKPAAAPTVTIPAGTQITVRMIDAIDGKTAKPGALYKASIAEPISVGSHVAVPEDSSCTIEVVSAGQELALRLHHFTLQGKTYSTSAGYAEIKATGTSKTKKAVRRGVGLGALGAGIGALAGGGSGAAIGAAVGGGVGAVSAAAAKGKKLEVPSETQLIFSLTAPVPLN
jgi:hypothetical protein